MRINFLGDSITFGQGAEPIENRFSTLVCKHFQAEECNYGVCGSRFARQLKWTTFFDADYFMARAVKMDKDADFTFVFGGTNDFGHGDAKLGKMGDVDPYTFYGAFEEVVAYLAENFPKERVCFILPLPRNDQESPYGDGTKAKPMYPLSTYIKAEKNILAKYGFDYLDFTKELPVPKHNKGDEFTVDGLHPNNNGYRMIANKLISYLVKNKKVVL